MYFDGQKVGWEEVDKFRGGVKGAFFSMCSILYILSWDHVSIVQGPGENVRIFFKVALLEGKTLNNNELNQVAEQQFLLKQWFSEGAHCKLKKLG